jgi:hypothetical protein
MTKFKWENAGRSPLDPARVERDTIYAETVPKRRSKRKSGSSSFEHRKRTAIKHREREYNQQIAERKREISRIEAMQVNDNRGPGERQAKREAKLRSEKRAKQANAAQAQRAAVMQASLEPT